MLRPLYTRYRERTRGASKLQEFSEEQTIGGSGGKSKGTNQRSKKGINDTLNLTTWEMDDYNPKGGETKFDTAVTTTGDESGSEKNLTHPSEVPRHTIAVEKKWTVTHS